MLSDFCVVCKSEYDEFVGLKFEDGRPKVTFPRGFRLSEDETQTRKDIVRLLATIQRFSGKQEGSTTSSLDGDVHLTFPILSYQYIIKDFLANGYYIERETQYIDGTRGKINWKRTVQKKQPVFNNGNLVYLDFVIKTNKVNTNNMLTRIHEYCVRESFEKLGWLYLTNETLPPKPKIRFNKSIFAGVLNDALNSTFNEHKRLLFTSMLNIVNSRQEDIDSVDKEAYGVDRFEYIWEKMIDHVFGEDNKEKYFPHATWHIISGNSVVSSALEPDTIMLHGDKIYILDAKYYKYGVTRNPMHLPASSSIEKQIVYGEYVEANQSIPGDKIYNAFVMPFDSGSVKEPYRFVSVGTADWKTYSDMSSNYEYVLGILMDTRYLIEQHSKHNVSEIEKLSELIVSSLATYRRE